MVRPVRVVGVQHHVAAGELRQPGRRLQPGRPGLRVVEPLVIGVASIEERDAVLVHERGDRIAGDALPEPLLGGVAEAGGRGGVGVPDVTARVCGECVDPGQPAHVVEHRTERLERRRPVHPQELFEHPDVVQVGVAVREPEPGPPAEQRRVQHRPVVAPPQRPLHRLAAEHVHRVCLADHVASFVAISVRRGRLGVELEAIHGEAVTARERVRPRDTLVEPHLHAGRAEERHAVDVELPGQLQVALPETGLAEPREVRVGEHHAVT